MEGKCACTCSATFLPCFFFFLLCKLDWCFFLLFFPSFIRKKKYFHCCWCDDLTFWFLSTQLMTQWSMVSTQVFMECILFFLVFSVPYSFTFSFPAMFKHLKSTPAVTVVVRTVNSYSCFCFVCHKFFWVWEALKFTGAQVDLHILPTFWCL